MLLCGKIRSRPGQFISFEFYVIHLKFSHSYDSTNDVRFVYVYKWLGALYILMVCVCVCSINIGLQSSSWDIFMYTYMNIITNMFTKFTFTAILWIIFVYTLFFHPVSYEHFHNMNKNFHFTTKTGVNSIPSCKTVWRLFLRNFCKI